MLMGPSTTCSFMPILKEHLLSRLNELRQSYDRVRADLHATDGAIQEVEHWLAEIDKPEKEVEEVKDGSNKPNNN